jgi:Spy/CpxP family protein refolding chaperone
MTMTRRTAKFGILTLVAGTLLGGVLLSRGAAQASGGWAHNRKAAIMKRIVSAHIDEVLDDAKVSDGQRQTINAARDRVFTAVESQHGNQRLQMEEALALFESDRIDSGKLASLRGEREQAVKQIGDAVTQALVETHDVLTAQQRKVVTDHIRSLRGAHGE